MLFYGTLLSQSPNYTIEVTYNLYASGFDNNEYLYKTNSIDLTNSKKVNELIAELNNFKTVNQLFAETKIDTIQILENPKELLKYYNNKYIDWNEKQIEFISEKLSQLETYKNYFEDYLGSGCCIHMHQRYRDEYVVEVFENSNLINTYKSRKSIPNTRKIPWTNNDNELNYNTDIDKILFKAIGTNKKYHKILGRKNLTDYLVTEIIDYHNPTLYKLSAYDYFDELNELKSDFEILNIGELSGRGRYIWNERKTYYARLTNSLMLDRINIKFLATKNRKSIYSRDSIKADYKNLISRVQNIEFLTSYIQENPNAKLDIYYFNNRAINDYNIDSFNKNPEEWERHDQFLERNKKYKDVEPKPSYANEDATRVSKQLYTGCNYRFDKAFVEQAIFIEINNKENKENSVWYLLPDNTVLLYLMQGEKVLDYDYKEFGKFKGIQYPCALFDLKGNIIDNR